MAWAMMATESPYREGRAELLIGCLKAENHLCEQIPGCNFDRERGIWHAPLTWAGYVAFRTVWAVQPIDLSPGLAAWGDQAWSRVQDLYRLRSALEAPDEMARCLDGIEQMTPDLRLTAIQRAGAAWLSTERRVALTDPPGTGKTPQAIRALQMSTPGSLPALVVAPNAALYQWRDEIARWAPDLSSVVVTGTAAKRARALAGGDPLDIADVYLIGWSTLRYHTRLAAYPGQRYVRCRECGGIDDKIKPGRCEVHGKELNAIRFGAVIADEAHRMQDATSKQTRAVWWLASQAAYFWPMTGTPVGDTVEGLWPILHAIDPDAHPAKSRYLDLYAIRQPSWTHRGTEVLGLRPDTASAFHSVTQPHMRRIPREISRAGMPARLDPVFRYPEMTSAQAKIYKQLKADLLADLPDGHTVVPASSLVRFTRCCQVASSSIETSDGEDPWGFTAQQVELALPSNKADDLVGFLADNPGPLVVACTSPRLLALLERKLGAAKITSSKITGGMTAEQQWQAAQWFQSGDVQVILLTAAGAEAITLTAASTIYFAQPTPSFFEREQFTGRIDRVGQRFPVRVVHALSPGTVDIRLYELGSAKAERAAQVTQDAALLRWIIQPDSQEVVTADA